MRAWHPQISWADFTGRRTPAASDNESTEPTGANVGASGHVPHRARSMRKSRPESCAEPRVNLDVVQAQRYRRRPERHSRRSRFTRGRGREARSTSARRWCTHEGRNGMARRACGGAGVARPRGMPSDTGSPRSGESARGATGAGSARASRGRLHGACASRRGRRRCPHATLLGLRQLHTAAGLVDMVRLAEGRGPVCAALAEGGRHADRSKPPHRTPARLPPLVLHLVTNCSGASHPRTGAQ